MTYHIAAWKEYQHYKDRNPPWIKLHYELLSSRTWCNLDDASRVLAVACMLIASRNDGNIPDDPEYLKRVAYLNCEPDFQPLLDCGFLQSNQVIDNPASKMLAVASSSVSVSVSKKRGAGEKHKGYSEKFLEAWKAYPTDPNMSKSDTWKKWLTAIRDRSEDDIVKAVIAYKAFLSKPDAPKPAHMTTWLNQKRYEGFLAEGDATAVTAVEEASFIGSLTGIEKSICEAITPPVYRSWLQDAKIRDGPEIEIVFDSDFRRAYFADRLADKASKAVGKKITCRTGT
jgi:hypothetical protein